jgi:competence ComEA-like helix-hairpin-helix protein
VPWPRAAQRVLLAVAAGLFALGAVLGARDARKPSAVSLPDDPGLDVRLDLNSAAPADLETLPGVGRALAGRIETYRSTHGPFRSVGELRQVPGFGEKLVQALRPYVTVGAR